MPEKKILNPSSSGMDIPDAAIERIARVMLPMIQKYYESDEGKMELETWNETHKKETKVEKDGIRTNRKIACDAAESRSAETESRAAAQGGETQNLYPTKQGTDTSLMRARRTFGALSAQSRTADG